jgi:ATP-dependent protease HslVU (ClpYQ) peptidase subunit
MTTIATDGKSMAADGLSFRGSLITAFNSVKVERLEDGRIVGAAGDKPECVRFRQWLREGGKPPKFKDFCALVLSPDGSLTYHTEADMEGTPTEAPNAIGSGEEVAIGAMEAGATAEQAIEITRKRNAHTGGLITVVHLEHKLEAVA